MITIDGCCPVPRPYYAPCYPEKTSTRFDTNRKWHYLVCGWDGIPIECGERDTIYVGLFTQGGKGSIRACNTSGEQIGESVPRELPKLKSGRDDWGTFLQTDKYGNVYHFSRFGVHVYTHELQYLFTTQFDYDESRKYVMALVNDDGLYTWGSPQWVPGDPGHPVWTARRYQIIYQNKRPIKLRTECQWTTTT
jgi:hypothetical protein